MKGFDDMKFSFKKGLMICLGIYGVLVMFDVYALNIEHNNGMASIFLTIVFFMWFLTYGVERIIKENEAKNDEDKK